MHIHILGVCGTFMAGVAALAKEAGYKVTGSDANVYPPMSTQLERLGIDLIEGYDPVQLRPEPDVVVVGNALSRGNAVVEAMLDQGLNYRSGPEWLAQHVLDGQHVIAVAGTHGKTTTASMLAWMLEDAGHEPGFLIGGVPANFDATARVGAGRYFVVEADEYDTAFFDKRAKFVHYRPRTVILNNLEYDHADIYSDIDAIVWQFHQLLRTVPGGGRILANGRDDNLTRVIDMGCWTPVESFGLDDDSDWSGVFTDAGQRRFRIEGAGKQSAGVWALSGEHNLENAVAAAAAAASAGVDLEQSAAALGRFKGVRRRLERTATVAGIEIYDDFAHHPTAIRRTVDGMKRRHPGRRIVVALEPRSNTMKMGVHNDALAPSLSGADLAFVYLPPEFGDSLERALADADGRIRPVRDYDALISALASELEPGDRIVFMSNGGFGAVRQKLTSILQQGEPA